MKIILALLVLASGAWADASPTPTPNITVTPCGAPYPGVWTPYSGNPILVADQAWEETNVSEPSVTYWNGKFWMSYSGGWSVGYTGIATSLDGIHWTKYPGNPVLPVGITRTHLTPNGNQLWLYVENTATKNLLRYTSNDGFNWTYQNIAVYRDTMIDADPYQAREVANFGVYKASASTWYGIVEGFCTSRSHWVLYLVRSDNGGVSFDTYLAGPFVNLEIDSTASAAKSIFQTNGQFDTWYHGTWPSAIYHAHSGDLYNWVRDTSPVIQVTPGMWGMSEPDQVADPCVIPYAVNNMFMYYSGMDNTNGVGKIGLAFFKGDISDYSSCTMKQYKGHRRRR